MDVIFPESCVVGRPDVYLNFGAELGN